MADISRGPVSSLPGSGHSVPEGATCDEHGDRPAVKRIQGETDSIGCEFMDMCQECYDAYKNRDTTDERTGTCEWCKGESTQLSKRRDFDEGTSGRVYDVCPACIERDNARLKAEYEESFNEPYYL